MKTFFLNTAGILLVSLLFFQCSKEPSLSDLDGLQLKKEATFVPFGNSECGAGSSKTKTLDLSNVVPSSLNGLSVSDFLTKIGWGAGGDLCTGGCVTGNCLPTSIEGTTNSDLQFETTNDGKGEITGAKWKNNGINSSSATVKIKADSCDCLI